MKKKSEKNRRSGVLWKAEQSRPEKFVAGARSKSPEQNRNNRRNKQKRQSLGAGKERKIRVKEKEKFLKPKIQGNWKVAGNLRVIPSIPLNQHVPRGHVPYCAAIIHLIRNETPSVTNNLGKETFHLLWPSWHVTDDHRTGGATDGNDENTLPWRGHL